MIRELIIGVSVAVIGVGAHAARAQAAAPLDSCSWKVCESDEECWDDGWLRCHDDIPVNCLAPIAYCINGWSAECGEGGYIECEGIQAT